MIGVIRNERVRQVLNRGVLCSRDGELCRLDLDRVADDQVIGRTQMRGIGVLLFGSRSAMDASRALIERHGLVTLRMPADGRTVVAVDQETSNIRLWEVASGKVRIKLSHDSGLIETVAAS